MFRAIVKHSFQNAVYIAFPHHALVFRAVIKRNVDSRGVNVVRYVVPGIEDDALPAVSQLPVDGAVRIFAGLFDRSLGKEHRGHALWQVDLRCVGRRLLGLPDEILW